MPRSATHLAFVYHRVPESVCVVIISLLVHGLQGRRRRRHSRYGGWRWRPTSILVQHSCHLQAGRGQGRGVIRIRAAAQSWLAARGGGRKLGGSCREGETPSRQAASFQWQASWASSQRAQGGLKRPGARACSSQKQRAATGRTCAAIKAATTSPEILMTIVQVALAGWALVRRRSAALRCAAAGWRCVPKPLRCSDAKRARRR